MAKGRVYPFDKRNRIYPWETGSNQSHFQLLNLGNQQRKYRKPSPNNVPVRKIFGEEIKQLKEQN